MCIKERAGSSGAGFGARGHLARPPAHLPRLPVLTHPVHCAAPVENYPRVPHHTSLCHNALCHAVYHTIPLTPLFIQPNQVEDNSYDCLDWVMQTHKNFKSWNGTRFLQTWIELVVGLTDCSCLCICVKRKYEVEIWSWRCLQCGDPKRCMICLIFTCYITAMFSEGHFWFIFQCFVLIQINWDILSKYKYTVDVKDVSCVSLCDAWDSVIHFLKGQ